jgi:hypothetical protein
MSGLRNGHEKYTCLKINWITPSIDSNYSKFIITLFKSIMGSEIFHAIFLYILHIQIECEEYIGRLRGILSVPHNNVMDLNDVMMMGLW